MAKKHDFTKTEIKAGLMVLLSIAVLAGFIATVTGLRPTPEHKIYYARFSNIIGLNPGADVRFGGVKCGRVADIRPDREDQSQVIVEVHVADMVPVNEKSIATIEAISLTAAKHLEISTGEKDAPRLANDSGIKSVTKSGSFVDIPDVSGVVSRVEDILDQAMDFLGVEEAVELEEKGEREFARITDITADVRQTLDNGTGLVTDLRDVLEEQRPNIRTIMDRITEIEASAKKLTDDITAVLAENREPIHNTLLSVEDVAANVQEATEDVKEMVDNLANRLDTLAEALQGTLDNIEDLTGNARHFLEMNRPAIEDMLLDLRETVRYLKSFSRTLSEQPQSIITGKSPEGRKN